MSGWKLFLVGWQNEFLVKNAECGSDCEKGLCFGKL